MYPRRDRRCNVEAVAMLSYPATTTHGNFAPVWNAIMNWNDVGVGLEGNGEGESSAP